MRVQPPPDPVGPAAWGAVVTPIVGERHPRRRQFHGELDSYTAIAVVLSVVFTVYQFCNVDNGLYRGTPVHTLLASLDAAVPWFFVLIGYRVFRPIAAAYLDHTTAAPTRTLLTRLAVAVLPAYYAVITVVWFCRQQSLPGDWRDLVEHLTFTQAFDAKRIFYTDGPAWAVSSAVFFLVLLAIANAGISWFGYASTHTRRLVVLAVPSTVLAATALAWKAWSLAGAHHSTAGSSTTWYGPVANLDNFAIGMVVAVTVAALARTSTTILPRHRIALRVMAAVVVSVAIICRHEDSWSAAYFSTICSVGFGGLVAAAELAPRRAAGRRRPRVDRLARMAAVAYGTYLWHEPVLLALNGWDGVVEQTPGAFVRDTLAVLAISVLVGGLSYFAIEQPTLQLYQLALRSRIDRASTPTPVASIHVLTTTGREPRVPDLTP